MGVLASFRPTLWQALARGLGLGGVTGVPLACCAGLVAAVLGAAGRPAAVWAFTSLALLLLCVPLGGLFGLCVLSRIGVDADEVGINRVPPRPPGRIPWGEIADLRAERRGGRIEVRAYLVDGAVVRLPAPYDGPLLAHDVRFDRRYLLLRQTWETRRHWRMPTPTH